MATFIVYDPNDGNKIKRWFSCLPETVTLQPRKAYERIAYIPGPPPMLGRTAKIYHPDTGEITDGETITIGLAE